MAHQTLTPPPSLHTCPTSLPCPPSSWDDTDATVVCRQLGYDYGTARTQVGFEGLPLRAMTCGPASTAYAEPQPLPPPGSIHWLLACPNSRTKAGLRRAPNALRRPFSARALVPYLWTRCGARARRPHCRSASTCQRPTATTARTPASSATVSGGLAHARHYCGSAARHASPAAMRCMQRTRVWASPPDACRCAAFRKGDTGDVRQAAPLTATVVLQCHRRWVRTGPQVPAHPTGEHLGDPPKHMRSTLFMTSLTCPCPAAHALSHQYCHPECAVHECVFRQPALPPMLSGSRRLAVGGSQTCALVRRGGGSRDDSVLKCWG